MLTAFRYSTVPLTPFARAQFDDVKQKKLLGGTGTATYCKRSADILLMLVAKKSKGEIETMMHESVYTINALRDTLLFEIKEHAVRISTDCNSQVDRLKMIDDVITEMKKMYQIPSTKQAIAKWIEKNGDHAKNVYAVYTRVIEERQLIKQLEQQLRRQQEAAARRRNHGK